MNEDATELWERYDRYAALRQRFQSEALHSVPLPKLRECALRLGLPVDEEAAQIAESDMAFAYDLAVHTGPEGRSRAIDRVARRHQRAEGEAAQVLAGLANAWFSVFRRREPHPVAGMMLEDVLLGGEVWLLDWAMEETVPADGLMAARLAPVGEFAIGCGAVAPLDELMLARIRRVLADSGVDPRLLLADARFPMLIYQRALGFIAGNDPDGF